MSTTKRLTADGMEEYFDRFSKHFLNSASAGTDVEITSRELGDQVLAAGAHLIGITYDPDTQALEVELETGDHRAYRPKEVWAVEEPDGFIRAIEIVRDDDSSEIVRMRRPSAPRAD